MMKTDAGRLFSITALLMLAVLLANIVVFPLDIGQKAYALSAVTFTTRDTATSVSTGQWKRVYENGTTNVIALDSNGNGTYVKKVYSDSGHTVTSTTSGVTTETTSTLTTPTASTASSTDSAGVAWYSQTSGSCSPTSATCEMFDAGTRQGSAEKIATVSSILYGMPVNNVTMWVCGEGNSGNFPGAAYFGVFDASNPGTRIFPVPADTTSMRLTAAGDCGSGFNVFKAVLAGSSHIMGTNEKVGVVYQSDGTGTTTLNFHANRKTSNIIDGTDSIESLATSTYTAWSDQAADVVAEIGYVPYLSAIADGSTATFWRNNVDSEAGAWVCMDQTVAKLTTGVKVYFPDANEIPDKLDIFLGSSCNPGGSPTVDAWDVDDNSVGYQSQNFTATSARYVTLKVDTWGSDTRWRMSEFQTYQEGAFTVAPAIGNIETTNIVYVAGRDANQGKIGIAKYDITDNSQDDDLFETSSVTPKDVAQTTSKVFVAAIDSSNNLYLVSTNRALDGSSYSGAVSMGDTILAGGFVHVIAYEGSPNVVYVVYSKTSTTLKIVKYTSSASIQSTSLTQASNADFSVIQLADRFFVQTNSKMYQLIKSSDAISLLYDLVLTTFYFQPFTINSSSRTYGSDNILVGNSAISYSIAPSTGAFTRTPVLVSAVNSGTGALTVYSPAKFYWSERSDLTIEASTLAGTTWNIKTFGTQVPISLTPYEENVSVPLAASDAYLTSDVFRLVCDAEYHINSAALKYFAVGSDSDCTEWKILATSSATVGRELINYTASPEPVHAATFTAYTLALTATTPADFSWRALYPASSSGRLVDSGTFDSSGNGQSRWLYGNCYEFILVEEGVGDHDIGSSCANDVTTKTITWGGGSGSNSTISGGGSTPTITISPVNINQIIWTCDPERTFGTSNGTGTGYIDMTVSKTRVGSTETQVFSGKMLYTDSWQSAYQHTPPTQYYNYSNVHGSFTQHIDETTGIPDNATRWFFIYDDNDRIVSQCSSSGTTLSLHEFKLAGLGSMSIFGVGAPAIFVILVLAVFPKAHAGIGALVGVGLLGVMWGAGLITEMNAAIFSVAVVVAIVALVAGYRKFA